ncbi:MAG TPA: hypothetical protein VFQ68_02405 [Streptosporangiaceae bacterium]|nr:hypothetical protein [Streptosporangiaceae bacterium]
MNSGTVTQGTRWKLVVTACGLALLAGCASGSTSPGGTSSAAPSSSSPAAASPSSSVLCADVAALRASLDQLTHVTVQSGMGNEITSDIQSVKAALTKLVNDARGKWQTQTSALSAALDQLKTAAQDLAASPGGSTVSAVAAALGQVKRAAQDLLAAAGTECPSASPSSSA